MQMICEISGLTMLTITVGLHIRLEGVPVNISEYCATSAFRIKSFSSWKCRYMSDKLQEILPTTAKSKKIIEPRFFLALCATYKVYKQMADLYSIQSI